jgi:hypothetical protein
MKIRVKIRNVDVKPYSMEFNLLETSVSYPHLRISFAGYLFDHLRGLSTGGILSLITIKPGPVVDLLLTAEDLTLKQSNGKKDEILMSSKGAPKRGMFKKLFASQKVEGEVKFRVRSEKAEDVLETMIPERKDFRLSLVYGSTNILSIWPAGTSPLLDIFLTKGSAWLVDDKNVEMCIMSTERNFDMDTKRFAYYDEPF